MDPHDLIWQINEILLNRKTDSEKLSSINDLVSEYIHQVREEMEEE